MSARDPISIEIRRTTSLSPADLEAIWAITERYVETSRSAYEEKLRKLPEVGLWRSREGALVGLVSLDVYAVDWEGRARLIFFTSNVVLDERFRRRNLVLRTGLRVLAREKLSRPFAPAYWFFDTFSFKSYALMSHNIAEFWPRRDRVTPDSVSQFMGFLATRRYGSDWSAATGIVRATGKRLRPTTAPLDDRALADPDVRFFNERNPGHRDGDMLVCLAPLTVRSLAKAMLRGFRV